MEDDILVTKDDAINFFRHQNELIEKMVSEFPDLSKMTQYNNMAINALKEVKW